MYKYILLVRIQRYDFGPYGKLISVTFLTQYSLFFSYRLKRSFYESNKKEVVMSFVKQSLQ